MISGSARDIKSEVQKCLACCSFFRSFFHLSIGILDQPSIHTQVTPQSTFLSVLGQQ